MSRQRLVLAGGTVASVAIGVARRQKRARRAALAFHAPRVGLVIPLLGALVMPAAFGWDGAGFIGSAWGFLTGLAGDIKDWVLDAINFAIERALNLVEVVTDGIQWGLDQFAAAIPVIAGQIADVASAVGHVTTQTLNWVEETFSNFRQQLTGFLEGAWDSLKDWVIENFPDWISGMFGDIWDLLDGLGSIGWDGLIFLKNLIDDPIGFLWNLLKDTVDDAIGTALGGLTDLLELLSKIWHILEWLASHAADLTEDVLSKLWDVTWWFIDHVDDFTIDALGDIFTLDLDVLAERMERALDENASMFEAKVAGWL